MKKKSALSSGAQAEKQKGAVKAPFYIKAKRIVTAA